MRNNGWNALAYVLKVVGVILAFAGGLSVVPLAWLGGSWVQLAAGAVSVAGFYACHHMARKAEIHPVQLAAMQYEMIEMAAAMRTTPEMPQEIKASLENLRKIIQATQAGDTKKGVN